MDAREQLQERIDEEQGRLAAGVYPDREAALLALVRAIDRLPVDAEHDSDLTAGLTRAGLGVTTALRLCLESDEAGRDAVDVAGWAARFLAGCRALDAARLVLRFVETGELRLTSDGAGGLDGWFPGGRLPSLWRERRDLARWAQELPADDSGATTPMSWQLPYPAEGEIGGVPVAAFRAMLATLQRRVDAGPRDRVLVIADEAVASELAELLDLDSEATGRVLSAFSLDAEAAGWHAALPGGPQPPLVRIGPGRLALSRRGLAAEPLVFAARELRRRDPVRYHNGAHQREAAFRRDLYTRFGDRRFVTSPDRIVLRRDDRRNRTDIDAAIFDRKTCTLALFELKSQDPYARTADEVERQRENLRRAGRQVSAMLDWVNRNGADEVLNRMDRATAKRFRVQRVLPFVLGRCMADAGGDAQGRVAWGSWGQVLRLLDDVSGGNPLLALHARLLADGPPTFTDDAAVVTIAIGQLRIAVHADWATVQG